MSYPPPGQGYPGGPPQNPYGQQPDPYGTPQYQSPDPYAQQPDPYAQQPDPYAQPQYPPADGGWGSPPQSGPAAQGYPDQQQPQYSQPMSGVPMTGPPLSGPPMSPAPQQMGPYNPMGMPPQPPKKSSAPLVVGLVLGVVALLGLGAVLVFAFNKDDEDPIADPTTAGPSPSDEVVTTEPAEERLTYGEFGNWTGSYGGASLSATILNGWDYESCADVEVGGALTEAGCEYALEVVYEAEGGDLRMAQLILAMTDESTASSMGSSLNDAEFEGDYRFSADSTLADYEEGLWMSDSGGKFIVLTITTRTTELDKTYLENYLYGKSDDTVLDLESR